MLQSGGGVFDTHLSKSWLETKLGEQFEEPITHVDLQQIGMGQGSFSRVGLATIHFSKSKNLKLIVKIPTCLTYIENRKRRGWSTGNYDHVQQLVKTYHNTEVMFYENVSPCRGLLSTYVLKPFEFDESNAVIVMSFDEGVSCQVYQDLSSQVIYQVLDLYSHIQGAAQNIPVHIRMNRHKTVFNLLSSTTLSEANLLQRFTKLAEFDAQIGEKIAQLSAVLPSILNYQICESDSSSFLVHGDLYSNNIMLNEQGMATTIIDFQLAHFGNPVEDIIRLLCTCTDTAFRRRKSNTIIEYYHSLVVDKLGGIQSVEQLKETYDRYFPMCGLWALVSLHASYEGISSQTTSDEEWKSCVVGKMIGIIEDIIAT